MSATRFLLVAAALTLAVAQDKPFPGQWTNSGYSIGICNSTASEFYLTFTRDAINAQVIGVGSVTASTPTAMAGNAYILQEGAATHTTFSVAVTDVAGGWTVALTKTTGPMDDISFSLTTAGASAPAATGNKCLAPAATGASVTGTWVAPDSDEDGNYWASLSAKAGADGCWSWTTINSSSVADGLYGHGALVFDKTIFGGAGWVGKWVDATITQGDAAWTGAQLVVKLANGKAFEAYTSVVDQGATDAVKTNVNTFAAFDDASVCDHTLAIGICSGYAAECGFGLSSFWASAASCATGVAAATAGNQTCYMDQLVIRNLATNKDAAQCVAAAGNGAPCKALAPVVPPSTGAAAGLFTRVAVALVALVGVAQA